MEPVNIRNMVRKIQKGLFDLDEKIDVRFLALFQQYEGMRYWDIYISSLDLSEGDIDSFDFVDHILVDPLSDSEKLKTGRIVIMNEDNQDTKFIQDELPIVIRELREYPVDFGVNLISERLGFDIRNAFLLRNHRNVSYK